MRKLRNTNHLAHFDHCSFNSTYLLAGGAQVSVTVFDVCGRSSVGQSYSSDGTGVGRHGDEGVVSGLVVAAAAVA